MKVFLFFQMEVVRMDDPYPGARKIKLNKVLTIKTAPIM
ncbi:hypothetical protein N752_27700 [Desulforamulus aquiferis]|nr:hypothetical protein N752_27700 [Desulforamulus aquiferis]